MSSLAIQLFGPPAVRVNGDPLPRLHSRKGHWLLALLVLRAGSEIERTWLAGTLWPDNPEPQALASLRNSLKDLRRALGPEANRLHSPDHSSRGAPHTLCLDLSGAEADVPAFDAAIARGDIFSLEQAVSLYRGPLLEGCEEEWVFLERHAREQAYLAALETLAAQALAVGELGAAERHLRRVIAVDPLRERAPRALMQALATGGNYAAALLIYRELRLRLHRELNTEPDPETKALFQQIRVEARARARARASETAVAAPYTGDAVPAPLPLPEGTITFLFTDIQGSTRLWEETPEAMHQALACHDTLLRHIVQHHGGVVIKTLGDQFCVAFATAPDAVAAALAAQRALLAEPWPGIDPLRVRMALHTGTPEQRDGDYFGPPLNRVSRLLQAGHGGQILLSLAAQELVWDHLPAGASLQDMGVHRLKDLVRPERIFHLLTPDLPAEFPPLTTLEAQPNNLPIQATPFIGREQEIAALRERLQRADVRLVTLTGPGGTGKTRLALQAAAELLDAFEDGVYFVPLAPTRDPDGVTATIAQVLGVRETGSQSLVHSLKGYLRERKLLLLLDNFEQVVEAAPVVAELLESCPRLKVLVTSRSLLRLRGEHEVSVPPLEVPDPRHLPELSALSQYAAVELFVQQVQAVKPEFKITRETAPAVAEICLRLDGLPLAIELAAARMRLFTPQGLLARLGTGTGGDNAALRLLVGGPRDLPARQQTLRSTIAWSCDLLDPREKTLFRRLSTFLGGATLEAAEVVCNARGDLRTDVLEGVTSLADQSLLRPAEGIDGQPRITMLETIREFAREALEESGEAEAIRREHARCFLTLAEQAEPQLRGPEQTVWLERLEAEHDNLRAALEWLRESDPETGLRLVAALWRFWLIRGHLREGRGWIAAALAHPAASGRTPARAKALLGAGEMARYQDDYAAMRSPMDESVAIYRELGDREGLAHSLGSLGMGFWDQGDFSTARSLLEESIPLFRELGDRWGLAGALTRLGMVSLSEGNDAEARRRSEEGLAIWRELGDRFGLARPLITLGKAAWRNGDGVEARSRLEEALGLLREIGDWTNRAEVLFSLALLARLQGDYDRARALCDERLTLAQERGDRRGIAHAVNDLGYLAYARGDLDAAQALLDRSLSLRRDLNDHEGIGWSLIRLAEVACARESLETAQEFLEESAAKWQVLENPFGRAYSLRLQGRVAKRRGDGERATALYRESLALLRGTESMSGIVECLEGLAGAAASWGRDSRVLAANSSTAGSRARAERAARLFGAATALRATLGYPLPPVEREDHDRDVAAARAQLPEETYAAAWAEGGAMSLDEAAAFALEEWGAPSDEGR